jgi:hypothetical protein
VNSTIEDPEGPTIENPTTGGDFFNCLLVPSGSDRNRIVITITAIFIKVGGFKGKFSATQSEFSLISKVVDEKKIGALKITSTGNVSVFKNKQMDIVLTANKRGVNFSITGDTLAVDDFKIRAVVDGKSKGISSSISIWIGSTESTNNKVVTLVIGKSDPTIDNEDHTYSVEVTARIEKGGDEAEVATKTITVTVTDLDDEAPTNIRIEGARVVDGQVALANNEGDDVDGKSKGISSSISIWIGSTESTNNKVVTLVIGKSDLTNFFYS